MYYKKWDWELKAEQKFQFLAQGGEARRHAGKMRDEILLILIITKKPQITCHYANKCFRGFSHGVKNKHWKGKYTDSLQ